MEGSTFAGSSVYSVPKKLATGIYWRLSHGVDNLSDIVL
jgi:hypothetical protein